MRNQSPTVTNFKILFTDGFSTRGNRNQDSRAPTNSGFLKRENPRLLK
ncbi:hypothetical protein X474_25230 [Dethiosulfatarculus sandiegensis]|uniref:Uncharacterized protein n=1 Tax=Dethiosulfatarculus sandiegensis TaxID=1429043 RepID=A0A0D2JNX1_9BACT|nr:hypothetical protein X474_25230 [Dethiosulfatarculus sandiegensis]